MIAAIDPIDGIRGTHVRATAGSGGLADIPRSRGPGIIDGIDFRGMAPPQAFALTIELPRATQPTMQPIALVTLQR